MDLYDYRGFQLQITPEQHMQQNISYSRNIKYPRNIKKQTFKWPCLCATSYSRHSLMPKGDHSSIENRAIIDNTNEPQTPFALQTMPDINGFKDKYQTLLDPFKLSLFCKLMS